MKFDHPFFGAKLFLPMAVAGLLAAIAGALSLNVLDFPWYGGAFVVTFSFALVFGVYLWLESPRE